MSKINFFMMQYFKSKKAGPLTVGLLPCRSALGLRVGCSAALCDHALFLPFQLPFFGGGGVGFGVGFGGAGGLFPLPPPDGLPVVLGAFVRPFLLIF